MRDRPRIRCRAMEGAAPEHGGEVMTARSPIHGRLPEMGPRSADPRDARRATPVTGE